MSGVWLLLIAILGIHGVPTAIGQGGVGEPQPASRTGEPGAGEGYYCRIPEMPVSWATRGQPVDVAHNAPFFWGWALLCQHSMFATQEQTAPQPEPAFCLW
jgi:hypothetical protein